MSSPTDSLVPEPRCDARISIVQDGLLMLKLGDGVFPALRVADPKLSSLTVRPTRLIGKADEVTRVRKLLAEARPIMLTAVGTRVRPGGRRASWLDRRLPSQLIVTLSVPVAGDKESTNGWSPSTSWTCKSPSSDDESSGDFDGTETPAVVQVIGTGSPLGGSPIVEMTRTSWSFSWLSVPIRSRDSAQVALVQVVAGEVIVPVICSSAVPLYSPPGAGVIVTVRLAVPLIPIRL